MSRMGNPGPKTTKVMFELCFMGSGMNVSWTNQQPKTAKYFALQATHFAFILLVLSERYSLADSDLAKLFSYQGVHRLVARQKAEGSGLPCNRG